MRQKTRLLTLLVLLMTAATGAWAQDAKHLITATYREQTRLLEQPLPYATTVGELYEAVSGHSFSDLISTMSILEMPLTGISSNNTDVVSIGELNGASTPVTVNADGKATVGLNFSGYVQGIFVSAISPLYVSLKDGVKDADKWTASTDGTNFGALPIGGLKGDGSETVTLQYNGRLKVKGVTATSVAAPAEATPAPEGAINGKFSVSATKQVYFSKGNLRYASGAWSFFDNQYDYYTSYSKNAWDKFGWSTSATTYGMNTSNANNDYSGDFVDWGATMGAGWFTLTSDEWTYLFNTRTVNGGTGSGKSYTMGQSVNGNLGVVFYPDNYTGEVYSGSDWATFESAGCVFLPAAGLRQEKWVSSAGSNGYYWSATPDGKGWAYYVYFDSGFLNPASNDGRFNGCSVRLVREVATSDAPAKEPATVTTAPTGAAIVGVGKSTALVSGGVADGGTLMYAVTTTNTKPTSTAGFSDAVPTAQTITASGTVYVWYYVKGDDTHSDSEIAATAIEVPVADIVWDVTNISSDFEVWGTDQSYEMEGVTLSGNSDDVQALYRNDGDPETDGISFEMFGSGGFTFTAPTGKAFTKIEMTLNEPMGWDIANLGSGWALKESTICTVTWTGSAASTVDLLTGDDNFSGAPVKSIVFYLSE